MRFTAKIKAKNQITVPSNICECYDIQETDFVELEVIKVKKK